ncbi:hypothetical protein KAS08_00800 [Candidatus Pacearchaeota archaeon]|nr:hypothetical protein [Candidatus Pacearchaeota archaeon]
MRGINSKNWLSDKRGQVWVETVIYTLIGLAVIGLVLAGALPKINQKKDEIAIEQSIEALGMIDDKIYEVQRAVGNRRVVTLDVKRGKLIVNMDDNTISWILESSFAYSQPGIPVSIGKIIVETTGDEKPYLIDLTTEYGLNLKYNGLDEGFKQLDVAPTPYIFSIENKGKEDDTVVINLNEQ